MATTPQQSGTERPANGSGSPAPNPSQPPPKPDDHDRAPILPPAHRYESSLGALRQIFFGRPLSMALSGHQRLPKFLALPIFSSDALSSVAYATEAILGVLILASTGALHQAIYVAIAICGLIVVVSFSYRQVIFAYPNGGGAYPVGKENLGTLAALTAGASLLVDYVLTVAVSVASGVDAIGSFESASLAPLREVGSWVHAHTIVVCLVATVIITLANLRGVRESGTIFAWPTYVFILSLLSCIVAGIFEIFTGHHNYPTVAMQLNSAGAHEMKVGAQLAGTYLILQAFSSGCSALTGLEAISNTVPFFQKPQDRNAAATMVWMCVIAVVLFMGTTALALAMHTLPIDESASDYQSIISQISHDVFDGTAFSSMYYVVQIATALVLVLAANTAFSGFPQLCSMLAKDRFLPRQLASVGDRLVYANGIILLSLASCVLLVVFGGNVYELIPLYAVGVFTSFTIAQAGMVRRWLRVRSPGWQGGLALNAVGAVCTAAVAMIFVVSKWASGVVISDAINFWTGGVWQWSTGQFHHLSLTVYRGWQYTHPGQDMPGFTIGPNLTPHYGAWIVAVLIPLLVVMFYKIHDHYMDAETQLTLTEPEPFRPVDHVVVVMIPRLHRGVLEALRYAQTISNDTRAVYVEIDEAATPALKEMWEAYAHGTPLIVLASPARSLYGPILRYADAVLRDKPGEKLTIVIPEFVSKKWWHNILHNNSALLLKYILASKRNVIVTNVRYFLD
jgi:amino acid transporter